MQNADHCNSNKSHAETLTEPERLQEVVSQPAPMPNPTLSTEIFTFSHSCSSWFWPHWGVRKTCEPHMTPTLTSPPNHAFYPHSWLLRIKKQCKMPLKKTPLKVAYCSLILSIDVLDKQATDMWDCFFHCCTLQKIPD